MKKSLPLIKSPTIKYCFSHVGNHLAVWGISFILVLLSGLYWRNLVLEVNELHDRLSMIQTYALRSQEAETLLREKPQTFKVFKACQFEQPHTPQNLLEALRYPPVIGAPHTENDLISQEVCFTIPCLFDEEVFGFIHQLLTQGPGLFHIHDLTISRLHPLTEGTLEKIAKGDSVSLFEGKVHTTWIHR